MTGWLALVAVHLLLPVLGAAAAFHPSLRRSPVTVRVAAAFLAGAVVLTAEGMLWSLIGVRWTVLSLTAPAAAASLLVGWRWARHGAVEWPRARRRPAVTVAAWVVTAAGVLQLAVAAVTGRAASVDLTLFWGVKASHWAAAGGLDAAALSGPFAIHTHPSYPPLFATILALVTLVAGELPWLAAPATAVLWVVASIPLVRHLLEPRLDADQAAAVTALWTVAVTAALVAGGAAGSAEPPLVAFVTVGLLVVLADDRGGRLRIVGAVAAAGAVLTKNEGAIAVALILAGLAVRALLRRGPSPWRAAAPLAASAAAGLGAWLGVRLVLELPLTDPIRERAFAVTFAHLGTILAEAPRHLTAGTRGLAWLLPALALLVVERRRVVELLPALSLAAGLFLFLGVYYLHAHTDPAQLVGWTLPRVTIPALSALLLAAGLGAAGQADQQDPRG